MGRLERLQGGNVSWAEVEIRGKLVRVPFVRTGDGVWIGWSGHSKFFRPERSIAPSPAGIEREVRAPMTGRVAELLAVPGVQVRAGAVLVVLEAMKMEYRLVAGRDAVIESVGCKGGDRVDLGQVLVTLAP